MIAGAAQTMARVDSRCSARSFARSAPRIAAPMLVAVALTAATTVTTGCATNPVTGKPELHLLSQSSEIDIGTEAYAPSQQMQGGRYVTDPALADYVASVGRRLARVSDRTDLPYEFVVINDSTPNAWALPGGKLAVNRGLLVELRNEAELAAVLGHEIVHAAARHGAQSVERNILLRAGVAAIGAAADGGLGGLAVGSARVGAGLIASQYSRGAELEADHYGMIYMSRAGYDPNAAIALQETFVRLAESRRSDWLSGLFASHPPSRERVEANRRTAASLPAGGELGVDRYKKACARLKSAQPAYKAYDEGIEALSQKNSATALAQARKAIGIEPAEGLFYGLRGQALQLDRKDADAVADYTNAIQKDPDYFEFYLRRGLVRDRLHDYVGAEADLQRANKLLPTAPAYYVLGTIARRRYERETAIRYFQTAASSQSEWGARARRALQEMQAGLPPS